MAHTSHETIEILNTWFGDNVISCNRPVSWPPRSYALTPLDYFLSGYVKLLVNIDKPETIILLYYTRNRAKFARKKWLKIESSQWVS